MCVFFLLSRKKRKVIQQRRRQRRRRQQRRRWSCSGNTLRTHNKTDLFFPIRLRCAKRVQGQKETVRNCVCAGSVLRMNGIARRLLLTLPVAFASLDCNEEIRIIKHTHNQPSQPASQSNAKNQVRSKISTRN